jgi:DNA-binding transcriptional LysR family regulator
LDTGVQNFERSGEEPFARFSWDDFRVFLTVSEAGSLKAAAKALSCSHNTVRSQVKRLEDMAGAPLVVRTATGATLTELGEKLRDVALEMKAASRGFSRSLKSAATQSRTRLHISVTEGLGTFWMVPRFAQFHEANPQILVTLDCKMGRDEIQDHVSDLAVQLVKPSDDRLVCTRLGALHLMPFASRDYLKRHGEPGSIEEARAHQWVLQIADQVRTDLFTAFFGEEEASEAIALKTNNSAAHYWAIAKGIGIGMLPTYARAITGNIVPIDMGLEFRRDIWLVYHPDVRQNRASVQAIAWIKEAFDQRRYPWFSDAFVHPSQFEQDFSGTNIVRLFAGFMDVVA